ncbi:MAG: hypothetical protein ACK4K0_01670 [Flavobacteriales bacterium]
MHAILIPLTTAEVFVTAWARRHKPDYFAQFFMIISFVKMLGCAIAALVLANKVPDKNTFLIEFILVFFYYLAVGIGFLLAKINRS